MPLEDLLAKVKDKKKEEKIELKREHQTALQDLDAQKREEYEQLSEDLQKKLEVKRQERLSKKEREEAFNLEMKRLERKKQLLDRAKEKAAESLASLSADKKEKIYLKKLKEKKQLIQDASQIAVPKGKKKELLSILKEAGINTNVTEKELDFKEGYFISGDKWTLEITLEKVLDKEIDQNKKEYVNTLFESN